MFTYTLSTAAACSKSRLEGLWWKPYGPQRRNYLLSVPLQKKFDGPCCRLHAATRRTFKHLYWIAPKPLREKSPPSNGWDFVDMIPILSQSPGVRDLNSFLTALYQVLPFWANWSLSHTMKAFSCLHLVWWSYTASHLLQSKPSPFFTPLRVPRSPTRTTSLTALPYISPRVFYGTSIPRDIPENQETADSILSWKVTTYIYRA